MDSHREEILTRLMLLDNRAGVCLRPTFPIGSSKRWYVNFGRVSSCSLETRGFGGLWADGATPEEALDNAWRDIVRLHCEQNSFLRIHNCPSDVYIPGDGPQTWVRWNETKHTWVDATPTPRALLVHNIPADRIRLYSDHRWREDP